MCSVADVRTDGPRLTVKHVRPRIGRSQVCAGDQPAGLVHGLKPIGTSVQRETTVPRFALPPGMLEGYRAVCIPDDCVAVRNARGAKGSLLPFRPVFVKMQPSAYWLAVREMLEPTGCTVVIKPDVGTMVTASTVIPLKLLVPRLVPHRESPIKLALLIILFKGSPAVPMPPAPKARIVLRREWTGCGPPMRAAAVGDHGLENVNVLAALRIQREQDDYHQGSDNDRGEEPEEECVPTVPVQPQPTALQELDQPCAHMHLTIPSSLKQFGPRGE